MSGNQKEKSLFNKRWRTQEMTGDPTNFMIEAAEAAYLHLAHELQDHTHRKSRYRFDMGIFTAEARDACTDAERIMFDACTKIDKARQNHG